MGIRESWRGEERERERRENVREMERYPEGEFKRGSGGETEGGTEGRKTHKWRS